jgi:hypothetical protein
MKIGTVFNGLAVLLAIVALVLALVVLFSDPSTKKSAQATPVDAQKTTVGDMQFEVVTSTAAQELGLSNRPSIPDNYGMLFVFPVAYRYGFWMKDMLVPIDIIWLSDTGDILLIDHSVDPSTYPHAFYPPSPVRYVLETKAGFATQHAWDVGTHVALPAPYGQLDKK